jgi:hypothetical protein
MEFEGSWKKIEMSGNLVKIAGIFKLFSNRDIIQPFLQIYFKILLSLHSQYFSFSSNPNYSKLTFF